MVFTFALCIHIISSCLVIIKVSWLSILHIAISGCHANKATLNSNLVSGPFPYQLLDISIAHVHSI